MSDTTPRIIPPTADLGAARLDRLDSEIKAHMQQAQQHYAVALSNRDAALNANAVGSSSQHFAHMAIMAMNLTVIEQNAAALCQQQIQTMLIGSVLACVTEDSDDRDEGIELPQRPA